MDLDELRTVQAKERRKDSLQHLRNSFYADVATYIADLRAQRDRRAQRVDHPFSDDGVRRLSDEIETAEEVAEAIYERRVGKVVKLASFAAADMAVEEEGMTEDERRLFDDLVDRIERNKATVLDALSGVTDPEQLGGDDASPGAEPGAVESETADSAVVEPEVAEPEAPGSQPERNPASEPATVSERPGEPDAAKSEPDEGESDLLADAMGGDGPSGNGETPAGTDVRQLPDEAEMAGCERDSATVESDTTEEDPSTLRTDGATVAEERTNGSSGGSDAGQSTGTDRTTVRITDDVGSILGIDDREYDLEREDVVTLPETNAGPLLEQGAAERLD
ncbi:hypothetical protein RH858_07325 [Halalkaliarchaeum sp. AArc-GB]|uniref:hypothetical protein n=1 Tax=Halalkaliarchaeum sp. AArc-GB TaxID=3074078 RepID=UPI00286031B1|nr:hypothetical protein [Halalkaliarchaeum sp. AArc-GB]MDR5672959.1 hypothetical protein [Halalkaliarchaeum sp. AArc-GB]